MVSLLSITPFKVTTDVRFDTPLNLYNNAGGLFFSLCEESGIKYEDIVNARTVELANSDQQSV